MVTTQSICNKNTVSDFINITTDVGVGLCDHGKVVISYNYTNRVHLSKREENHIYQILRSRRSDND